ncbi:hypothetical protein C2845_PM09G10790 [Panicum miliaceum]|uniref:Uncharacterized protein n=1 Tax=Panicum miliaceum TaxID=4540 RepID=A0A3L6RX89_PANMI|nr:hypothetical protein C2845_PM09G10790 [Panicum miliaceum]
MVMWYLLVADRLRCFFSNPKDAELMRWWDSDKRKKNNRKLRHPADARKWKRFDELYYQEFGKNFLHRVIRAPLMTPPTPQQQQLLHFLHRVIQAYGNQQKGKVVAEIWHAANRMDKSKSKSKVKSKDDSNSSASRQRGFSLPRTDTEHNQEVGVDTLPDLPDCPKRFEYGRPFLPKWAITMVPSEMQRMHNWYLRGCRLGLHTIRKYLDFKVLASLMSCSIFETSTTCSALN